jgi:hypothetical protein
MPIQCRTRKKKGGDDYTVCYEPDGSRAKKKNKRKNKRSAARVKKKGPPPVPSAIRASVIEAARPKNLYGRKYPMGKRPTAGITGRPQLLGSKYPQHLQRRVETGPRMVGLGGGIGNRVGAKPPGDRRPGGPLSRALESSIVSFEQEIDAL